MRFDRTVEAMRTVDLLALDDFGAQSGTLWARERFYQLVNYRVHPDAHLPPLVTSKGWSASSACTTAASLAPASWPAYATAVASG